MAREGDWGNGKSRGKYKEYRKGAVTVPQLKKELNEASIYEYRELVELTDSLLCDIENMDKLFVELYTRQIGLHDKADRIRRFIDTHKIKVN